MRGGFEARVSGAAERENDIKWVYAAALPAVEGRPHAEVILGVPQEATWLQREETVGDSDFYHFELPVNFIAGADKAQMTASGRMRVDQNGNVFFRSMNFGQNDSDRSNAWEENNDRYAENMAGVLSDAIAEQCKTFLANVSGEKRGAGS